MVAYFQPSAASSHSTGTLADAGVWPLSFDLGAWGPTVWAAGAIIGYLAFMAMNPLRGYLADSYDLLREKGHGRLVFLVALFSLAGIVLDWWRQVPSETGPAWGSLGIPHLHPEPSATIAAMLRPIGGLFGVAVAGTERGFGEGARNIVLTLASGLLSVAVGFLIQFFLLLFLYLRVTMPGRVLKVGNLVDLSVRRIGTLWPVLLGSWLFWSLPVAFGFEGWLRAGWSFAVALAFTVFAFLEVSVLKKNRPLREAVVMNFSSWQARAGRTLWFLAVACVHGIALFLVASLLRGCVSPGSWLALAFEVVNGFVRAFVIVWLLGAWVIFWSD